LYPAVATSFSRLPVAASTNGFRKYTRQLTVYYGYQFRGLQQRVHELPKEATIIFSRLPVARPVQAGSRTITGSIYHLISASSIDLHKRVPEISPAAATNFFRLPVAASTSGFPKYSRQHLITSLGYRQKPPPAGSHIILVSSHHLLSATSSGLPAGSRTIPGRSYHFLLANSSCLH
jgi:hypothetical protein